MQTLHSSDQAKTQNSKLLNVISDHMTPLTHLTSSYLTLTMKFLNLTQRPACKFNCWSNKAEKFTVKEKNINEQISEDKTQTHKYDDVK